MPNSPLHADPDAQGGPRFQGALSLGVLRKRSLGPVNGGVRWLRGHLLTVHKVSSMVAPRHLQHLALLSLVVCLLLSCAVKHAGSMSVESESNGGSSGPLLCGQVVDQEGRPIWASIVTVKTWPGRVAWQGASDKSGEFTIPLPVGKYSLRVEAVGCSTKIARGVSIRPNSRTRIRFVLAPSNEPGGCGVGAPLVTPDSTSSGVRVWVDEKGVVHVERL
jgi:hypothetical protein